MPISLSGPLVPARLTMVTAWDVPKDPFADTTLDDSRLSKEVRWGLQTWDEMQNGWMDMVWLPKQGAK